MKTNNLLACCIACIVFVPLHLHSQTTRTWSGGNGTWSTGSNWSDSTPPTGVDTANFTTNGELTVSFSANATMNNMLYAGSVSGLTAPTLTFDLGGNTLTATSTGNNPSNSALILTSVSSTSIERTLNIQNGQFDLKTLFLSTGTTQPVVHLNILTGGTMKTGDSSVAPNTYVTSIGFQGAAELNVTSGGVWTALSNVAIGSSTGVGSTVTVTGAGSSYNASTAPATAAGSWILTNVGQETTGNIMEVENGATAAYDIINVGRFAGSEGTLSIDGVGSSATGRRLYVGGGVNGGGGGPVVGGTGMVTISNGAILELSDSQFSTIFAGGTISLNGGGTLSMNSTLDNAVDIRGGILGGNGTVIGNVRLTGETAGTLNGSGGQLVLNNKLEVYGRTNISASGTGTIGSGTVSVNGTTTVRDQQTLEVNGVLAGSGALTFETDSTASISGVGTINKNLSLDLRKTLFSSGTLTLGGNLTIAAGSATSGAHSTISAGTVAVNGTTTVNNGRTLTNNGTLAGTGNLVVTGTIAGSGSVNKTGGTINGGGTISQAVVLAGNTTLGTLILGSTLDVSGTGNTLAASTSPTVAGLTTIASGGDFAVNGTLGGAGAMTVNGVLSGTGSVNKAVTVGATGTLSPGNSPGNQNLSSLTLTAGGNYNWQVYDATGAAGTGFDTITLTGTLDLTGLITSSKYKINLWSLSSVGPDANGNAINFDNTLSQSWVLVDGASVNTTGLSSPIADYFTVNTAAANGANGFINGLGGGSFSVSVDGSDLLLNFDAIPEPATLVLTFGGLCYVMLRRRTRRA